MSIDGDGGGSVDSPSEVESDWGANMQDVADAVGETPADEGVADGDWSVDSTSVDGAAEAVEKAVADALAGAQAAAGHETYAKPAIRPRPGTNPGSPGA